MGFWSSLFGGAESSSPEESAAPTKAELVYEPSGHILHAVVRSEKSRLAGGPMRECLTHFLGGMPSPGSNIHQEGYRGSDWDREREVWDEDEEAFAVAWVRDLVQAGDLPDYDLSRCQFYINLMARDYQTDAGLAVLGIRVADSDDGWKWKAFPAS